jgi:uncharacterized protein
VIRNWSRASTVAIATGVLVLAGAIPASAHVTVHTDEPSQGASDAAVIFRTPNEEDHAATVKLQVFLPTATPLLDVLVEPMPGWHFSTKTAKLAKPVTTDDGSITEAVDEVTWTADSTAAGLQPGEAADFTVDAGQLPKAASVMFRALQTYSNGDVVKWIEIQAPGADEPEHPAPVLHLAAVPGLDAGASSTSGPLPAQYPDRNAGTSKASKSSDSGAIVLGIAALVVALIAAGLAGLGLRRRS